MPIWGILPSSVCPLCLPCVGQPLHPCMEEAWITVLCHVCFLVCKSVCVCLPATGPDPVPASLLPPSPQMDSPVKESIWRSQRSTENKLGNMSASRQTGSRHQTANTSLSQSIVRRLFISFLPCMLTCFYFHLHLQFLGLSGMVSTTKNINDWFGI